MHYPIINPQIVSALKSVILQSSSDPQYLTNPTCPYSQDLKELLKALVKGYAEPVIDFETTMLADTSVNLFEGAEKFEVLQTQYELIFSSLMNIKTSIQNQGHTDKTVAYFKTVTSILEKLIGVGERIHDAKSVYDFKTRVLNVIEGTLSDEQRQIIMTQLRQDTL